MLRMVAIQLAQILEPAYKCSSLDGACMKMRWEPTRGLFPRGYAGAAGALEDIELVVCIAEPGEPGSTSKAQPAGTPAELPQLIATSIAGAFETTKSPFHRNVAFLLSCCWPGISFGEQMRRTWITEGVLCSAKASTARVPASVERECATRYLRRQMEILPDAFVIALGRKAERRLRLADRAPDVTVIAAGLPAGNWARAKPSWEQAGRAFQDHRRTRATRLPPDKGTTPV
jgi:hypothetical protein